jgi:hypothetical protein
MGTFVTIIRTDRAFDYKMELDEINDFHDGNVGVWFSEIV